jgi:hypothetical protein
MIDYLRGCLDRLYSAIFPYFITLEAELRPEPDPNSLGVRFYNRRREFLEKHQLWLASRRISIWITTCRFFGRFFGGGISQP